MGDTNVGGIGSEEDKALRKQAAQSEPAWAEAGKGPGVQVWRIEYFKVIPVDQGSYGKFHKGDSYIVLNTEAGEGDILIRNIYFWLGAETTVDEQGTAAYKTVELDDFFDGEPTQHREVMGEESDTFKGLFGGSIELLEGGVDSGFKHVPDPDYDPKMYQVRRQKGQLKVIQAPLRKDLLNDCDCFILDSKNKIYVYDGDKASPFTKQKANTEAENIENKRGDGTQTTHDMDDGFWSLLK